MRPETETTSAGSAANSPLASLKEKIRSHYDRIAERRDFWYRRNNYYHSYIESTLRTIIPPGARVLELGSATGSLLSALAPTRGLGLDLSPRMVQIATRKYPHLEFQVADAETFRLPEKFDFVVASDLLGELGDILAMLDRVHEVSSDDTRLIVTYHNPAHEPILRLMQSLGQAMRPSRQNWIGPHVVDDLLYLADFRVEWTDLSFLVPKRIPWVSEFVNDRFSRLRGLRYLSLVNVAVARPIRPRPVPRPLSASIVIACRNEAGNVESTIRRIPPVGVRTEIIFVDGASSDGTKERIEEQIKLNRGLKDIKLVLQVPDHPYGHQAGDTNAPSVMLKLGKGDAVRKGFEAATGDVLLILDADLTVPPEDLPRFFDAIAKGKGEFVNGSRLVYPMEERAMPFANYIGNKFFSVLFTWMLEQRVRDTLCANKALLRSDYERIKNGRAYFGEFDPFGDFDLLFGAARLGMKIIEVPVRYHRRLAGFTKVRVLTHGWLLLAMSLVALRKLKLAKWRSRLRR